MAELTWKGKGAARKVRAATLITEERHGGASEWHDRLVLGEAERVLPALSKDVAGQVALVYIDPPFDTGGRFDYQAAVPGDGPRTRIAIPAYADARGLDAWLAWFSGLAADLHALLAVGGSLYVHLDAHAAHYAKIVLDEVFGQGAFQREIVWRIGWISGFKSRARSWIRNHDTILFYAKGGRPATFHKEYVPYPEGYVRRDGAPPTGRGYPVDDVWNGSEIDRLDSIQIMSFAGEKVGYPTQKNEALVARIIRASSNPGDLVLDCCSGSGTTAAVASKLGRRWIACDAAPIAIHVGRRRLLGLARHRPFVVERDARVRVDEGGRSLDADVIASSRGATVTLRSYVLPRHPALAGRPWAHSLEGYCIDWSSDGRAFNAGSSVWRGRRGELACTAEHRFDRGGRHRVRVRAYDVLGGSATCARSVAIE